MRNFIAWCQKYYWLLVVAAVAALIVYGYVNRVAVGEFFWGLVSWTLQEVLLPILVLVIAIAGLARIVGFGVWWGPKKGKKD